MVLFVNITVASKNAWNRFHCSILFCLLDVTGMTYFEKCPTTDVIVVQLRYDSIVSKKVSNHTGYWLIFFSFIQC